MSPGSGFVELYFSCNPWTLKTLKLFVYNDTTDPVTPIDTDQPISVWQHKYLSVNRHTVSWPKNEQTMAQIESRKTL